MKRFIFTCVFNMLLISFIFGMFLLIFNYADTKHFTTNNPILSQMEKRIILKKISMVNYTWNCRNNKCERSVFHNDNIERISLETCNMICGETPMLWPKPQKLTKNSKTYTTINKNRIFFNYTQSPPIGLLLKNITNRFLVNLNQLTSDNWLGISGNSSGVFVEISIKFENLTQLRLTTDEDYTMKIRKNGEISVKIEATTYFGVRHALETLTQLIWFDKVTKQLNLIDNIEIEDFPKFPYRGLMIDTARNFFTIQQLTKIIDGMSLNKLNVLHLHLTDVESFPIVLPTIVNLANYGAYQSNMVYTIDDISNLVDYGRLNGVRVIFEIDAPAHVDAGWNFAQDQSNQTLIICNRENIFNGHLNPDNSNTLNILELIYRDLLLLQDNNEIFHIGGDEVNLTCWRNTAMAENYTDMYKFWTDYLNLMLNRLKSANSQKFPPIIVLWSSPLTESINLKELVGNITVQYWYGNPTNILNSGNSVIYSTVGYWYLDCGYGPWRPSMGDRGNCDPYTPWQKVYKYQPWSIYGHQSQTLGGEVCLWSEQVEIDDLETRIWPRTAAFAERLWTDPKNFNDYDIYTRFVKQRERLLLNGIKAAGIWPRWCSLNPGKCGF